MTKYVVTEEDFNRALANAGPLARKRLLRKIEKVVTKGINAPRPCADLEEYAYNFVLTHKDKHEKA